MLVAMLTMRNKRTREQENKRTACPLVAMCERSRSGCVHLMNCGWMFKSTLAS